jgi:hypothetical protein
MAFTPRVFSVSVLMVGLGLLGTPADAATPVANPTQVTNAAAALGVTGTPHTTQIGGSDNGDAVKSALRNAASSATSSDPQFVYFPASKTYDFGTGSPSVGANVYLVLADGVTITKSGSASATLNFTAGPSGAYGGTWKDASSGTSNLVTARVRGVKLANLTLNTAYTYGVSATSGSGVTLTDVTVNGSRRHGVIADGATVTLNHSDITNSNVTGLALTNGSTGTITDSHITGNGVKPATSGSDLIGHGVGIEKGSKATLYQSYVNGNSQAGISINGKSYLTITGGQISSNGRHGIGTRADSSGAPTINFANADLIKDVSYIDNNAYDGVLAVGGTVANLKNVKIRGTKAWALSVEKSTVTLSNSLLDGSGLNNASIRSASTVTFNSNNTVSNAKGGTYNLPGPDGDRTEKGHGLAISAASKFYIKGTGNVFSGNKYYGILLSGSSTYGKAYATAQSVNFGSVDTPKNGVGPGKVQDNALMRLEPGFSTTEFPAFKLDTGGRFDRQK